MRAAPAIDAALSAGGPERMLIVVLHAVAGAVLVAWAAAWVEPGSVWPWAAGLCVVAGVAGWGGARLARRALPPSSDRLRWDGQAWSLRPVSAGAGAGDGLLLAAVTVTLDLGRWVLLRLQPATGGIAWRVADARTAGPAWHTLRVALLAHAGPSVAPEDGAGRAA